MMTTEERRKHTDSLPKCSCGGIISKDRVAEGKTICYSCEPPTVTISLTEYEELQRAAAKLEALEANGVDNWCGYSDALESMEE